MSFLRGLFSLAVGGLIVVAGGGAPALAGTPATVTVTEYTDAGFIPCGATTLSFTGTERSVSRFGQSASGNQTLTHVVSINGVVTDEAGNVYRIHGAQTGPTTIQVRDGVETYQQTLNDKFVILDLNGGGVVDKFNTTVNVSFSIVNGEITTNRYHLTDHGTCSL
jgi:hypothetical protein